MKGYITFVKAAINLVGVSIVFPLTDYISSKGFNVILAGGVATAISALLILLFEYILIDFPYHFLWFRKMVSPISNMEGAWVEVSKSGERVISLAKIEFDYRNKKHVYSGCSYSKDGMQKATWMADTLLQGAEEQNNTFMFLGKGKYIHSNDNANVVNVNVVGQVECRSTDVLKPNKLTTGYASYYDYGFGDNDSINSENKNVMIMNKLNSTIIKKTIGKKKLSSDEDERKFIIEYYENKSSELFE